MKVLVSLPEDILAQVDADCGARGRSAEIEKRLRESFAAGAYPMPGQQPAVRVNAEAIIRRAMKITRVPPTPTAVPIPTKATVAATAKALGASLGPGAVKVRVPERFGPLAGVQLGPTASKPGSRLKTK